MVYSRRFSFFYLWKLTTGLLLHEKGFTLVFWYPSGTQIFWLPWCCCRACKLFVLYHPWFQQCLFAIVKQVLKNEYSVSELFWFDSSECLSTYISPNMPGVILRTLTPCIPYKAISRTTGHLYFVRGSQRGNPVNKLRPWNGSCDVTALNKSVGCSRTVTASTSQSTKVFDGRGSPSPTPGLPGFVTPKCWRPCYNRNILEKGEKHQSDINKLSEHFSVQKLDFVLV